MLTRFKSMNSVLASAALVLALGGGVISAAVANAAVAEQIAVPNIEHQASKVSAHDVVTEVTDEVMSVVRKTQTKEVSVDDAAKALDDILSQVVDFKYIVLNVMGKEAVQQASKEQLQEFAKVFKQGLIDTYAKGMTSFSDNEVKVLPPQGDVTGHSKVTVYQEVKSSSGTSVVSYTMSVSKDNEWVLRNVVLNGINLGMQFRSQFRAAIKQNNNDLDKVIANWNA